MSILDKAKRFLGRGRPKLSENAIDHSKIDRAVLKDLRKKATALDEAMSSPPIVTDAEGNATPARGTWERLAEDVFDTFFGQSEPRVKGREEMDPGYLVNREVIGKHLRAEEFPEERAKTFGRPVPSALATMGALSSLHKSFEDELSEHVAAQEELGDTASELDAINEFMSELREQREQAPERAEDIDAQMRQAAKSKREAQVKLEEQRAALAPKMADMNKAVATAVAKAHGAAQEAVEAASMVPGIGKELGGDSTANAEAMFGWAERVRSSPVLRKVLDMMGRLELSMGSTRREQRRGGFEDIVDIEFGDDLQVVLAHEKALLNHPILKRDFYRRLQERSLMQYETVEERELKRGSVVFVNDGSASMKGPANVLARGLTLATVNIAHREHRDTVAIEFGGPGQARAEHFPKERPLDPETMIRFAEQFYNGGTSTLTGMRMAAEIMRNDAPFHTADLVIITDGFDHVTAEDLAIRDELRAMGVRIHGIAIGMEPTNYLLEICDVATSVTDYTPEHNQASDRLAIDLT